MKKRINRYSAETSSALPNGLFLILSVTIVMLLIRDATALIMLSPVSDYWNHIAVLREWLQSPASPSNPAVNDAALTPQFVPLYWLLAWLGRTLVLDAVQLMTIAAVANFVLLATGLKLFLFDYFRHAWAPFIGLLVMFFCWGVAGSGAGQFLLSNFLQIAGAPSTFAFAVSLLAFWATMRLLRSSVALLAWAFALLLLIALAFVSHPATGLFGVMGCMLLAGTEFSTSQLPRIVAFGALLVGLAATELWPFFSAWKLVLGLYGPAAQAWSTELLMGGLLENTAELVRLKLLYDPSALLAVLGLILLGLPILLRLAQRGEQPFIFYGALLLLLPYGLNLLFDMPLLAYQCLLFAAFYLQLALVWGWLRLISAWSEIPRPALAAPLLLTSLVAGAALIALNLWLIQQAKQGRAFSAETLQLVDSRDQLDGLTVPELYDELLQPVNDDAVLLASADIGRPLQAFGRKLVAPSVVNPLVADMQERTLLTEQFFGESLTDLERVAVIQRYDVSHVLTARVATADSAVTGLQTWLDSYSTLVAERSDVRVYELAEALHEVQLPKPDPVVEDAATAKVADDESTVSDTAAEQPASRVGNTTATDGERRRAQKSADDSGTQDAPRSFGTPIAEPVFDPERHGG